MKNRIIGILVITILVIVVGYTVIGAFITESVNVTVNRVERVTTAELSYYLVYTDVETFKNTDSIFHGKWTSSDLHGSLKEGERYRFNVCGFRIPVLSSYRNVISAEVLESSSKRAESGAN